VDDVALLVQVLYESRFMVSRAWAVHVWVRVHPAVVAFCNRVADPLFSKNLLLAKV
jgi:hypothetical protein